MSRAVLLHRAGSIYDDVPWERYHFPNRAYLKAMRQTVGDWIVYYEPQGRDGRGRQAYVAVAHVDGIEVDPRDPSRSYAFVSGYEELASPVPLIGPDGHYEHALKQPDGSTNRGLRQRAVRRLADAEFDAVVRAGLAGPLREVADAAAGTSGGLSDELAAFERPVVEQLLRRPVRDAAFRDIVLRAYDATCAFTGLKIVNGRGRAEVDAAHIRPVGDNHRGCDSVRNGLALSKTIHWLFDRGILAVADDYRILESPGRLPERLRPLLNPTGRIHLPERQADRPHPSFLAYHRAMFEDEYGDFHPLS